MPSAVFTTKENTKIFFKDWGSGQPIMFHHGWPLSGDDWDNQMLFFAEKGYRVVAHDRRGHGRSTQTDTGNDMDTYARDCAELVTYLDLKRVIHVGHSTGGGEVARYIAQYAKPDRTAKAVFINGIPPVRLLSATNPGGTPIEIFDSIREGMADRSRLFREIAEGPFYGLNRPGANTSQSLIDNWWRQAMMGGGKPQYDCIRAFSETDHTDDLRNMSVPTLVMHSQDDQIVPFLNSAPLATELLSHGRLKAYKDLPHGMHTTHFKLINADLLDFFTVSAKSSPRGLVTRLVH